MNLLDILLLVAAVCFAVAGYRQGFVVGVLSVVGFVGGGVVAVYLLPLVLPHLGHGTAAAVVAVLVVIGFASLGEYLTLRLAHGIRRHIHREGTRWLDSFGGSLVNVISMLVVAWLLGTALAGATVPYVSKEVRQSRVLAGVQRVMPRQADGWFSNFQTVLARNGFPQVFEPFTDEPRTDVPAPDPALVRNAAVSRDRGSIVKVVGTAPSCGKVIEGSGFVYAPHRVMTNAHVVGGVREPTVQIGGKGRLYDATVVLYDPERDIAVLDVPDLDAKPLSFAGSARTGDGAIVVGFPEDGPFDVRAARVRGRINADGPDLYHQGNVTRAVYSLYALVRQGNSGGPLLAPDGRVYGVIFAKSLDDAHTGYALTASEVASDAAAGARDTAQVSTRGCAL